VGLSMRKTLPYPFSGREDIAGHLFVVVTYS
jgi:hypothetical protein